MTPAEPSLDTPETWGAASRGYAEKVAPHITRAFADAHIERLGVDAHCDVLEVGAGSGALTDLICGQVRSLLATDFAPKMIEVLQERLRAVGATNVRCAVMDGQKLELDDSTFDGGVSSFALMLFPDRVKGFSELNRVLRPGARAVVSGWAGPERFEAFGLFLSAVRAAFPDMPPAPSPPPIFSLASPTTFRAQMEAGGFRDVEVDLVARELRVADFQEAWGLVTVGAPPVRSLFDRVGEDGRNRLRDAFQSIVEERFSGGPISLTNVATLGSGVASGE